jgi:hypothetical protein
MKLDRAGLRQWRYPPPLRIAPADEPPELVELVRALKEVAGNNADPTGHDQAVDDDALAKVATGLWRARRRMLQDPSVDATPRPEVRKEFRHVQAAWDALAEAGVKVQDHEGEPFRLGQSLEVLTYQPRPELEDEQVIETIRPSIYARGRTLQVGQVIVGTPEAGGDEADGNQAGGDDEASTKNDGDGEGGEQ